MEPDRNQGRIHSREQAVSLEQQPVQAVLPLEELTVRLLDHNTAQVTYFSEGVRYHEERIAIMSITKPNPDDVLAIALEQLDGGEAAKLRATTAVSDAQKSLDKLFDYTKFHIGLYLTLTASYVAVASMKGTDSGFLLKLQPTWFLLAVSCFMAAGLAGGVIASSITQTAARSSETFLSERIGPWNTRLLLARTWTWIEHTTFWAGLVFALLSVRTA